MEKNNKEDETKSTTSLWMLPEGCIAEILALTTPLDVCRLSLVSKSIQSAADSDSVWDKFLPSDYQSIIAQSLTPIPNLRSKKDLYVYLCHHPLLIDGGLKSFSLEKRTGKKSYFLSARDLFIVWSDTPQYWKWTSVAESRFSEVAKLKLVWWLEIRGRIKAGLLSPQTSYTAYFVYKLRNEYGFHDRPSEVSAGIFGVESEKRLVLLDRHGVLQEDEDNEQDAWSDDDEDDPWPDYNEMGPWTDDDEEFHWTDDDAEEEAPLPEPEQLSDNDAEEDAPLPEPEQLSDDDAEEEAPLPEPEQLADDDVEEEAPQPEPQQLQYGSSVVQSNIQRSKLRDDGWFEVELGEFFTENVDDCIEMSLLEVKSGFPKRGLTVEGIEIRPKMG